ncbi:TPM domain-containing protein [Nitratiruptor sp. YY09-18]|uniref:TPM domain-containing protein n=1 Tax=Nitratiruptor sp. YY09-18 TaxID=2724901 RepID=UPI0019160994|nr:TPM domain-containing protein [Nitratiruptor sp. YY09-18]BCD68741.1 arginine/ornithine antiporter ArcD [Nitratiruptor sp. YY09-18]
MSYTLFKRAFALLILSSSLLFANNFILKNDNILPQKTVDKINEIGNELASKTGVKVFVVVIKSMEGKKIKEYESAIAKKLQPPFVLLTLSLQDKKVDIVQNPKNLVDAETILSPLPWKGTIIPILTAHFKNPHAAVEAAILNGYSEIAEQIADKKQIKLKSAIGNTNRNIYYWMRILFYSIIALILGNFIYRRFIKR